MWVINRKNLFLKISAALVVLSLLSIAVNQLNLSIDFTGGSIFEVEFSDRPTKVEVENAIAEVGQTFRLQQIDEDGLVVRAGYLDEADRGETVSILENLGGEVVRESAVGPSVGSELRSKAIIGIALVSLAIILFIAFAFRKVSYPVKSWKYGTVAVAALIHDILIPTGVFALLGVLVGYEVDLLFVMGLLVILGYSVNDTIVVFDRIRENLMRAQEAGEEESFTTIVGESLSQTYSRSINTSLTTLIVLLSLYIFGPESINHFALMLIVGVIAGTYSSIFLASPLLTVLAGDKTVIDPNPPQNDIDEDIVALS